MLDCRLIFDELHPWDTCTALVKVLHFLLSGGPGVFTTYGHIHVNIPALIETMLRVPWQSGV
jgi:hypothetical protein